MTLCINPRCDKHQNSDNAQFCHNCQSTLLLKQRYRATKVLGGGGFGKTYEASDLGTLNKVIKVLINNSPKAVELFQREAEVLSQLNNPGIPKVEPNSYIVFHPADGQEPVHCLVMEKVEGMNLRDYLKQLRHPIDSETAERWLKELVLILQEVHERGILHRDIKPHNIIFKPDGRLSLIDFGAVREGTGTEVVTGASSGGGTEVASHMAGGTSVVSRGYTAPEQMNGQAMRQSDFYSLGRTFVFLLTGKEPSEISYDAYNDVLQWQQYAPNVNPKLADLLDQMQSTPVRQRPNNAQDVLQKLQHSQSSSLKSPQPSPIPDSSEQPVQNSSSPLFLYISVWQLIIFSVVSFGVYQSYWIYKNWRYLKEREGLKIKPFWRGVFSIFFCHSLLHRIHRDKAINSIKQSPFSPTLLATIWVCLAIVSNIIYQQLTGMGGPGPAIYSSIFLTLSTLPFVAVQNHINFVTRSQVPNENFYQWSWGHTLCLLLGIASWMYLYIAPPQ
jgi:serine/threonine protein kinase